MFSQNTGVHFEKQCVHISSQYGFTLQHILVHCILSSCNKRSMVSLFYSILQIDHMNRLRTCIRWSRWGGEW